MKTVPATKFKNSAAEILEEVYRTGKPVLVTRRGQPLAQVIPPAKESRPINLGGMKDRGRIIGDIVGPIGDWNPDFPDTSNDN